MHEFAQGLSDDYLLCRELGHNWRPHTAALAQGYYERRLKCPRCKSEREEQLSMTGLVLRRQMHYSEGYLAKNMGRIVGDGREQLRLASIERLVQATNAPAAPRRSAGKPTRQRRAPVAARHTAPSRNGVRNA